MHLDQSLRRFGTVYFSTEMMKQLIGVGEPIFKGERFNSEFLGFNREENPNKLECGVWLMFVPDIYKEQARNAVLECADDVLFKNVTDEMVNMFISAVQSKMVKMQNDELGDIMLSHLGEEENE